MNIKKTWIGLLLVLGLRFGQYYYQLPERVGGEVVTIRGVLGSEPAQANGRQTLSLDGLYVSVRTPPEFHYGDEVMVEGKLLCYDTFRCIRGRIERARVSLVAQDQGGLLGRWGYLARMKFQDVYFGSLKREEANLLSGVLVGSIGLDRTFKEKLANVGLTHVVAASGMNLTLFVGFLIGFFKYFHWSRPLSAVFSIGAVVLYAIIAGFAPAIVRAGLMVGGVLIGLSLGRKGGGWWGLVMAGYLMLWVDPRLIVDFSFLLSFASMMGQIVLSTWKIHLPNVFKWLAENILQSVMAIVFTLPIIIIGFARFSLISMISNLLVLWTIEPLMILGGLAGIVGLVLPELAKLILIPAGVLLDYFLSVVKILGTGENFLLRVSGFNGLMAVGYYLILAGVYYYLMYYKTPKHTNKV
ncbi:MAG: internalization-related competence protein ComEC/Rec2 protein [Microgenomates group bacterium GW2011_GWA1_48_10]|uniref:ComEC/Rec2-related protein domain-containing protein n=1 Tax=Candidatus Gottesmanbacteria bacterium RIFCSPHIGHO2_01_FULL_47_48 TaxID=1798381 RepID=A0A1F6A4E8_9BACT|nr:MAG: internalization-related competence protein ComEC/Rec2 protein [Microgenomates group bacterium GW2011_GWA1_48_10]OGG19384.1 MAG: hypothetical protein A2721_02550 [Candidatus Gottesmanbacteria bacterium RIFCSPHIGHO2_01_FULL_47_48]